MRLSDLYKMAKRIYNQTALFGPLYAYLVVISPPVKVLSDLQAIKQQLNNLSALGKSNLQSTPHITLFEKLTDDDSLHEMVRQLLQGQKSFEVQVNGFTAFEHVKYNSIVLPVSSPEPVANLNAVLKGNAKTPFLTFAKWLPTETTQLYMEFLNKLNFQATWQCTEVLVLRKLMSEKHLGFREKIAIPLERR